MNDLFAQVDYIEEQDLDKAIEKTGHNIKDVTAVIMGRCKDYNPFLRQCDIAWCQSQTMMAHALT
jgi:hypothetical protein